MTPPDPHGATTGQQAFARRAADLGLRCWCFDAAGVPGGPAAPPPAAAHAALAASRDGPVDAVPDAAGLLAFVWPSGVVVVDLAAGDLGRGTLARGTLARDTLVSVLRHYHADLARADQDAATLDGFSRQLSQSYEEVNLVYRLAKLLTSRAEPAGVVQTMCDELRGTLNYGWLALAFTGGDAVLSPLRHALLHAGPLPGTREQFLADCRGAGPPGTMPGDAASDDAAPGRVLLPARHALAARSGAEVLVERLTHDGAPIGLLLAGNRRGAETDVTSCELQLVEAAANFLGLFHENAFRFAEQRRQFHGTLHALSAAVDAKDAYTNGHSERVARLGWQLATAVGFGPDDAEAVRVAGLLHDIGKIGVPEAVLGKTGRLTDEEFAVVRRHPQAGFDILKGLPSLATHLPGVLHHHERWDGRGYPHGLAGEAIPLIARVLAYADTFDAMSSSRSYRRRLDRPAVLAELRESAGTQLDPGLLEAFVALDFTAFDALLAARESAAAAASPAAPDAGPGRRRGRRLIRAAAVEKSAVF